MAFCPLCNKSFRDTYNYNRHCSSKKCIKKQNSVIDFNNCTLLEKDLLEGEVGVAEKLWKVLELDGKYRLLDPSRRKFEFSTRTGVVKDNNCYKLIKFCQPIVNKKVEQYFGLGVGDWLELAPILKKKVLSTKELGSAFSKRIVELAS